MEYYRKSLEEGPRYEKYTPSNFAEFLIDARDHVMAFPELKNASSEMDVLMKEGLEDVWNGKKADGAKKVRNAAFGGSLLAIWLLGLHLTANVKNKQDLHLGIGCLQKSVDTFEQMADVFALCYSYRNIPVVEPENNEDEHYSICFIADQTGQYECARFVGELCYQGYCIIGSIKVNCGYYKEPIEVIEKKGKVDVYAAPYLPVWYVWKTIGEKIGTDKMNMKAGVILYDEDVEDPMPTNLRLWDEMGGTADLTHYFYDGAYILLPTGLLVFCAQPVKQLSYELGVQDEEFDGTIWRVNLPEDWDLSSIKVQYDIARYVNNILFDIAKETLPDFFNKVREEKGLAGGRCRVIVDDVCECVMGEKGEIAIKIPFFYIKYPEEFLEEFFIHLEDMKNVKETAHCWAQRNDPNTTTMNDRYLENWGKLRKECYEFLYSDDD